MASVRLYLHHNDPGLVFRFRRPDGTRGEVPGLRLRVYVNLSPLVPTGSRAVHAAYPPCVLDTASYLTTIPERVWSQFLPGAVTPLPFDPAMPVGLRSVNLPGGRFPYDLAEVPIRIEDQTRAVLDVTVVAKLTHDGGQLTIPMVLGLRGGVLDGRVLRAEPDPTAPHGQRWTLEDP